MKILWMTWKDRRSPLAGGAEFINEEIAKRLARDGHEVVMLVAGFKDCKPEEVRDAYKIIRVGNRYSVYWHAYRYYKKHLVGWADLVIDEMNTIPFLAKFYVKEKNLLLAYQLCREIWFYQMFFPLNIIGYLLEPFYLYLLRDRNVLTESESAKADLQRFGFKSEKISVFQVGIDVPPIHNLSESDKFEAPTVLSLGAIRAMKRTLHQIYAFEIAKESIPKLKLKIAGRASSKYGQKVLSRIAKSKYTGDIEYLGSIDEAQKTQLMRKSHIILVTSVKEGWGLIVTEANSQGTPAVVYDIDGLRDSVRNNRTGWICEKNTPRGLADRIKHALKDQSDYQKMRQSAWEWSHEFTLENCYREFLGKIKLCLSST